MMGRRFLNWWLRFGYWLLLRLNVEGLEHVPTHGPVILMINHINFLDPFVVVASMPRQVTAMSKLENMTIPFWGLVFRMYGAIPVRRGEADRKALKQALTVLKGDTMLLIGPEVPSVRSRRPTMAWPTSLIAATPRLCRLRSRVRQALPIVLSGCVAHQ